jgi:hypothetical protein
MGEFDMRTGFLMVATALGLSFGSPAFAQETRAQRPVQTLNVGQAQAGELSLLDNQRRSGKYEDIYRLNGRAGQRIALNLRSDDFDSYLLVSGPGGYQVSNDDRSDDDVSSALVIELPADGTYLVSATSFIAGTMGAYRLEARPAAAGDVVDAMLPAQPITMGASIQGGLEEQNSSGKGDKLQDVYRLTARRGERVRIDLVSQRIRRRSLAPGS